MPLQNIIQTPATASALCNWLQAAVSATTAHSPRRLAISSSRYLPTRMSTLITGTREATLPTAGRSALRLHIQALLERTMCRRRQAEQCSAKEGLRLRLAQECCTTATKATKSLVKRIIPSGTAKKPSASPCAPHLHWSE